MNTSGLDLNLLTLFEAIYMTRSISRAATLLDMNQPTVSNALARLRKQLDDPLFVRDGRGVAPTPRAESIIVPVRRALADIRSITEVPEGPFDPLSSSREMRLYMIDVFEPLLLPALASAADASANMQIRLLPPQAISCEDAVLEGLVDLGVGVDPERRQGLLWEALCPMDLVVIARKGHPQVDGTITPQQIATLGHVVIDLDPTTRATGARSNMRRFILGKKHQLRYIVHVPRPSAIPQVVSQTDLIGFTPRFFAEALSDRLGLQILEAPAPLSLSSFYLVWREETDGDPALKWLREQFKATLAPYRPVAPENDDEVPG